MLAPLNISRIDSQSRVNHHSGHPVRLFVGFAPALLLPLLIFMVVPVVYGQSNAETPMLQPAKAAQSDAQKALKRMKTLAGSWQGTIMGISINLTIRAASSGNAVLLEANTDGGRPPNHEITMFYLDGDRLLATHYCDAGNRARFEGKMSPDENKIEFSFLDVSGSTRGGFVKGMVFTMVDADHHIVEFTFVMPDGKPTQLRGEFQRTASLASLRAMNKRVYDGGAMMLLLSAEKTPEEYYSFKPVDAVLTFGQMLAYIADDQYKNCSVVLGEKNPRSKIEGARTSKTELIAALKDAFAYCGTTYDAAALTLARGRGGLLTTSGRNVLSAFDEPPRQALMFLLHMHNQVINGAQVFWGLWLLPLALLIFRSRFLPRFIAVWLTVNGAAYVALAFVDFLLPQYSVQIANIVFPALLGELVLMLWLIIRGVNMERWRALPQHTLVQQG